MRTLRFKKITLLKFHLYPEEPELRKTNHFGRQTNEDEITERLGFRKGLQTSDSTEQKKEQKGTLFGSRKPLLDETTTMTCERHRIDCHVWGRSFPVRVTTVTAAVRRLTTGSPQRFKPKGN
ncbi:hypothetical protein B296_00028585 [Ensete ventricosum]|uniref:Uncharacterized protein n=1 Tax=Ensete ventricosum TaxID=4639 RepID=A0A426YWA1_ENSVE|nr:hypothetical protein B296_00028585 [Ensete ventricosum]